MKFGKLTTQAGAVALSRAASTGANILTGVVLAWMLGKELNGLLQKSFIVTQIAILAGAFGIQTSLFYLLPRVEPAQKRPLARQSITILFLMGLALAAIVFFGADTFSAFFKDSRIGIMLRWGAAAVLVSLPAMAGEPLLIAQERAWASALVSTVAAILQVSLTAFLLWNTKRIELVFAAIASAQLIRLLLGFGLGFSTLPLSNQNIGSGLLVQQLTYVLPVGITSIIDTLSTWLDRTLVSHYYPSQDLAVYTYGATEVPFIAIVIGALTPVLLPQFSRMLKEGDPVKVLRLWHRATAKSALVLFTIFVTMFWVAPEFLATLYSPKYRDSSLYFRIYLLLLPIRIVAFMPLLFALGRKTYVTIGAVGDIVLNLIISLFLMRWVGMGMSGAAVGTVIATLLQAWFYLVGIRKGLNASWHDVLPWGKLIHSLLHAGVILSIPMIVMKLLLSEQSPIHDLEKVAIAAVTVSAYSWFFILPRLRTNTQSLTLNQ